MTGQGQLLLNKYDCLPQNLQREVLDFVDFLANKYQKEKIPSKKEKKTISTGKKRKSNFGSAKGFIVMGDDFDQPLDEFFDSYNIKRVW
jgi:hypothetical protein